MSYGNKGSQMLSISKSLEVHVSFSRIERMWENIVDTELKPT